MIFQKKKIYDSTHIVCIQFFHLCMHFFMSKIKKNSLIFCYVFDIKKCSYHVCRFLTWNFSKNYFMLFFFCKKAIQAQVE